MPGNFNVFFFFLFLQTVYFVGVSRVCVSVRSGGLFCWPASLMQPCCSSVLADSGASRLCLASSILTGPEFDLRARFARFHSAWFAFNSPRCLRSSRFHANARDVFDENNCYQPPSPLPFVVARIAFTLGPHTDSTAMCSLATSPPLALPRLTPSNPFTKFQVGLNTWFSLLALWRH